MSRVGTALSKARRRARAVNSRRSDQWASSSDGAHCSRCGAWLVHWGCRRCDRWTASGVVLIAGFMLVVGLVAGVLLGSIGYEVLRG